MPVSAMPAVERIARVLAAEKLSANAEGGASSASIGVENLWGDHVSTAVAVLKTLREPDEAMAAAGDPALWEAMVAAGLEGTI